ncbi:MAG: LuxR C-terminal-related transcriptional regulator [Pseudomonadota bacterium]
MITPHPCALASTFVAAPFGPPIVANDANSPLRQQVIEHDASKGEALPLAQLWRELASGTCRVVDGFFTQTQGYLVTTPTELRSTRALDRRCVGILAAILRGSSQKALSFDMAMAPSTVTLNARRALDRMGLTSKPSRVHPLLILAAGAAGEQDESVTGRLSVLVRGDVAFRVVSVARPDSCLLPQLSGAEVDVVRCLVEGYSHVGMAELRGTSSRTIANQIASVFRRLRVTGRIELVHRLFALSRTSGPVRPVAPLGVRTSENGARGAMG